MTDISAFPAEEVDADNDPCEFFSKFTQACPYDRCRSRNTDDNNVNLSNYMTICMVSWADQMCRAAYGLRAGYTWHKEAEKNACVNIGLVADMLETVDKTESDKFRCSIHAISVAMMQHVNKMIMHASYPHDVCYLPIGSLSTFFGDDHLLETLQNAWRDFARYCIDARVSSDALPGDERYVCLRHTVVKVAEEMGEALHMYAIAAKDVDTADDMPLEVAGTAWVSLGGPGYRNWHFAQRESTMKEDEFLGIRPNALYDGRDIPADVAEYKGFVGILSMPQSNFIEVLTGYAHLVMHAKELQEEGNLTQSIRDAIVDQSRNFGRLMFHARMRSLILAGVEKEKERIQVGSSLNLLDEMMTEMTHKLLKAIEETDSDVAKPQFANIRTKMLPGVAKVFAAATGVEDKEYVAQEFREFVSLVMGFDSTPIDILRRKIKEFGKMLNEELGPFPRFRYFPFPIMAPAADVASLMSIDSRIGVGIDHSKWSIFYRLASVSKDPRFNETERTLFIPSDKALKSLGDHYVKWLLSDPAGQAQQQTLDYILDTLSLDKRIPADSTDFQDSTASKRTGRNVSIKMVDGGKSLQVENLSTIGVRATGEIVAKHFGGRNKKKKDGPVLIVVDSPMTLKLDGIGELIMTGDEKNYSEALRMLAMISEKVTFFSGFFMVPNNQDMEYIKGSSPAFYKQLFASGAANDEKRIWFWGHQAVPRSFDPSQTAWTETVVPFHKNFEWRANTTTSVFVREKNPRWPTWWSRGSGSLPRGKDDKEMLFGGAATPSGFDPNKEDTRYLFTIPEGGVSNKAIVPQNDVTALLERVLSKRKAPKWTGPGLYLAPGQLHPMATAPKDDDALRSYAMAALVRMNRKFAPMPPSAPKPRTGPSPRVGLDEEDTDPFYTDAAADEFVNMMDDNQLRGYSLGLTALKAARPSSNSTVVLLPSEFWDLHFRGEPQKLATLLSAVSAPKNAAAFLRFFQLPDKHIDYIGSLAAAMRARATNSGATNINVMVSPVTASNPNSGLMVLRDSGNAYFFRLQIASRERHLPAVWLAEMFFPTAGQRESYLRMAEAADRAGVTRLRNAKFPHPSVSYGKRVEARPTGEFTYSIADSILRASGLQVPKSTAKVADFRGFTLLVPSDKWAMKNGQPGDENRLSEQELAVLRGNRQLASKFIDAHLVRTALPESEIKRRGAALPGKPMLDPGIFERAALTLRPGSADTEVVFVGEYAHTENMLIKKNGKIIAIKVVRMDARPESVRGPVTHLLQSWIVDPSAFATASPGNPSNSKNSKYNQLIKNIRLRRTRSTGEEFDDLDASSLTISDYSEGIAAVLHATAPSPATSGTSLVSFIVPDMLAGSEFYAGVGVSGMHAGTFFAQSNTESVFSMAERGAESVSTRGEVPLKMHLQLSTGGRKKIPQLVVSVPDAEKTNCTYHLVCEDPVWSVSSLPQAPRVFGVMPIEAEEHYTVLENHIGCFSGGDCHPCQVTHFISLDMVRRAQKTCLSPCHGKNITLILPTDSFWAGHWHAADKFLTDQTDLVAMMKRHAIADSQCLLTRDKLIPMAGSTGAMLTTMSQDKIFVTTDGTNVFVLEQGSSAGIPQRIMETVQIEPAIIMHVVDGLL